MEIRPASLEDITRIAEIHVQASLEAYRDLFPAEHFFGFTISSRIEAFSELLDHTSIQIEVADGNRIEGFSVHSPSRDTDVDAEEVYEIQSVYVAPGEWRHGVGLLLMQSGEAFAESEGYQRITLWVLELNEQAIRFYERLGYWPDDARKSASVCGRRFRELRFAKELRA